MDLPDGLTHRPLTVDDAAAVFELWSATERTHLGEVLIEIDEVTDVLGVPSMDLATDSVGVLDGEGLVGWATYNRTNGLADVAATHTGRGIGTWLAEWFDRRAGTADVAQEVHVGDTASEDLLAAHGYAPAFTSWVLRLPADAEIPERGVPDGVELGTMAPGEEHAVHEVVEAAFGEWGQREPMPYGDWERRIIDSHGFTPEQIVVCRIDGQVVGASVALDTSDGDCWVAQLAVRADQRGRGLAQAMMARTFADGRARGKPRGILATDSRTGALPLYEKLGLRVAHESREWIRPGRPT